MPSVPFRFATRVLCPALLLALVGGQCGQTPQQAPSSPDTTAVAQVAPDTLLPGAALLDSTEAALRRFEAARPPTALDSTALRQWTTALRAAGDSLETRAPDSARTLFANALRASRALADSNEIAKSLNGLGTTYYFQSRFEETLQHWRQALSINRSLGNPTAISTNLNNIAIVHARQGRYDKALPWYRKSLELAREQNDQDGIASSLNNIGLLYQNQGQYEDALRYYQKSLSIEREQGDRDGIAASLNNIGLVHENQGRYEDALDHYQRSLTLERELGDRSGIASTLNNVGLIYKNLGRYDDALARYRESLALQRELGDRGGVASALSNIGYLHFRQGRLSEALRQYRKGLSIERKIDDRDGVAQTLSTIGEVREQQGRFEEALARYRDAHTILRDLGDRSGIATALQNIGDVYRRQRRYKDALRHLRKALSIHREIGDRARTASTLNAIGNVLAQQTRYESALTHYRDALRINRTLGRRPNVAQNLENVGAIHLSRDRLQAATDTLERAVQRAETLRQSATSPEARRSLLSTQIESYRALTNAYVRAEHPDSALRAVEQARARLLAERLTAPAHTDTSFSVPTVRHLQNTLGPDEAALLYANADANYPLTAVVATRDTVHAQTLPDDSLLTGLHQAYSQRLARLREEEGPLVNALSGASAASLTARPSLATTLRLYRYYLTRDATGDTAQHDLARRLYDLLLAPVEAPLQSAETVTVVPTGALGYLPFETLRAPTGRYLIETQQVHYAQSLTVLGQLQERRYASSRKPLLALGGADYGAPAPSGERPLLAERRGASTVRSAEHAARLYRTAERRLDQGRSPRPTYAELGYDQWPTLYGTKLEVQKLKRTVGPGATLLTGGAASEDRMRALNASGDLARYRRLHFATHGIAMPEAPQLSALVLSQKNASDSLAARDGYLAMPEIADLRLQADVAVLSACRTGLGRIIAGEGVVNLSHAFLRAGANATLVSQWRVLDWSTQQFMTSVYRTAQAPDTSFAEAVTLTKRAFISGQFGERNTDPLRWAPFVYYGRE